MKSTIQRMAYARACLEVAGWTLVRQCPTGSWYFHKTGQRPIRVSNHPSKNSEHFSDEIIVKWNWHDRQFLLSAKYGSPLSRTACMLQYPVDDPQWMPHIGRRTERLKAVEIYQTTEGLRLNKKNAVLTAYPRKPRATKPAS